MSLGRIISEIRKGDMIKVGKIAKSIGLSDEELEEIIKRYGGKMNLMDAAVGRFSWGVDMASERVFETDQDHELATLFGADGFSSHVTIGKDDALLLYLRDDERSLTKRTKGGNLEMPRRLADELDSRLKQAALKAAMKAEEDARRAFSKWAEDYDSLEGEHGEIILPNPTLKLLEWAVTGCNHVILLGEPGVGKTDTTRALAKKFALAHYHLDVTGMSDVSQIEAERFIENKDGVAVTGFRPSALIKALESACGGTKTMLDIQEIARVQDMSILNPLFHLISHNEYPCTVTGITYKPEKGTLLIAASANVDPRFNFAGNSRRGIDDGLLDRFLAITLERPTTAVAHHVLGKRGLKGDYRKLWELAGSKPEYSQVVTFRRLLEIAKVCNDLGWTQAFAVSELLAPRFKVQAHLTAFIAAVEGFGI